MNALDSNLQRKTAVEQVKLLFRHGHTALAGSFACLGLAYYLLKNYVSAPSLFAWSGGMLAIYLVRVFFTARFQRLSARGAITHWQRWKSGYLLGSAAAGTVWGMGTLILPDVVAIEAGFALLIGGMSASSATVHSAVRGGSEVFMLPAMLMMTAYLPERTARYIA